jgi:selenide,water dikinase
VYKLSDELALVQTVDFFTPIVDDPRSFGMIAAANALSDIYAMGAAPLTALNIVAFPNDTMPKSVLAEILLGGLEKIHEAGALLLGGHTIDDTELKFGMAVTGIVHPDKVLTNAGAKPGDALVLTKPIGTGIINTAAKGNMAKPEHVEAATRIMATLNKKAAGLALKHSPHALTDVTGFGLAGHLTEMLFASDMGAELDVSAVPILEGAREYASIGLVPAGTRRNTDYYSCRFEGQGNVSAVDIDLLNDAQTSGGLLVALAPKDAKEFVKKLKAAGETGVIIGRIVAEPKRRIIFKI